MMRLRGDGASAVRRRVSLGAARHWVTMSGRYPGMNKSGPDLVRSARSRASPKEERLAAALLKPLEAGAETGWSRIEVFRLGSHCIKYICNMHDLKNRRLEQKCDQMIVSVSAEVRMERSQ